MHRSSLRRALVTTVACCAVLGTGAVLATPSMAALGDLTEVQRVLDGAPIPGGTGMATGLAALSDVALSSDGRLLYTAAEGSSEAIAVFSRDRNSGRVLEQRQTVPLGGDVMTVELGPGGGTLYAIVENTGELVVFDLLPTGLIDPTPIDTAPTGSVFSTADTLTFSPDGTALYSSALNSGAIFVFSVASDGTVTPLQTISGPGLGTADIRQTAVTPDGRFLYTASSDGIGIFSIAPDGALTHVATEPAIAPQGTAITVSPDGTRLFVASSDYPPSTIWSAAIAPATGALTLVDDISFGPPEGGHFDLLTSADGTRLYVSSYFGDETWTLAVDASGAFSQVDRDETIGGNGMVLSDEGRFLYVAEYLGHGIRVFEREVPSRTLKVAPQGNGTGTVAGNGLACGTSSPAVDCEIALPHGTYVSLAATPGAHTTFGGFGAPCSATPCEFTLLADTTLTATFTLHARTLTVSRNGSGAGVVTSAPAGIDCGSDCTEGYPHGQVVTLNAEPAPGSRFTGWAGACTGTGACVVTLDAARAATATFAPADSPPAPPVIPAAAPGTSAAAPGTACPPGNSPGVVCTPLPSGGLLIVGTPGPDRMVGADGPDVLIGGDGDDTISGGRGNDTAGGGPGDDTVSGNEGDDTVYGDDGDDTVRGADGDDTVRGGTGDDRVEGNAGDDFLTGDAGDDNLLGGTGDDRLSGGAGDDRLSGQEGDDSLHGLGGNDRLFGGPGTDGLSSGPGRDLLRPGDDARPDRLTCATGTTTIVPRRNDVITRTCRAATVE